MGIFNLFGKKKTAKETSPVINQNSYLIDVLKSKLNTLGYEVEKNEEYLALTINSELEIAGTVIDIPNTHPSLIQIMILLIHPEYFPKGIIDNVAGIGSTIQEKIDSALENYLNTTFNTIMESFKENHIPEMDFTTKVNDRDILWHPNFGELVFQGEWKEFPDGEPLYEILKEKIKSKIKNQKFNWLKLYISKNSNNEIIGECLFNNEPWEEGLEMISKYAEKWGQNIEYFLAQKQFIVFKRCDAFDHGNNN
jgi:hypothetical protein